MLAAAGAVAVALEPQVPPTLLAPAPLCVDVPTPLEAGAAPVPPPPQGAAGRTGRARLRRHSALYPWGPRRRRRRRVVALGAGDAAVQVTSGQVWSQLHLQWYWH